MPKATKKDENRTTIIVAVIGALATIIAAYIGLFKSDDSAKNNTKDTVSVQKPFHDTGKNVPHPETISPPRPKPPVPSNRSLLFINDKEIKLGEVHNIKMVGGRKGTQNTAFSFNGKDSYVKIYTSISDVLRNNDFTINVWFYKEAFAGTEFEELLSLWTTDTQPNAFFIGFKNNKEIRFTDDWKAALNTNNWELRTWHMLTCVSTPANAYIYIDGKKVAERGTKLSYKLSESLIMGKQGTSDGEYFLGKIEAIRIYSYSMGEREVENLYNTTK